MDNASSVSDTPSFEKLFRQFMGTVMSNAVPSASTAMVDKTCVDAVPGFSGVDIGEDANKWCDIVETITEKLSASQRLSLATHALVGPAKNWYQSWDGTPRTWVKFREDLCSVFVTEDRLCERLSRAVAYTSDSAESYSEYARNKLKFYGQTRVEFKQHELISLVIGHVTDSSVRQSLLNARYKTTAEMLSGMSQFVKAKPVKEAIREKLEERSRAHLKRRCYSCNEEGHTARFYAKQSKLEETRNPPQRVIICTYCHKRGHGENNCFTKQRARRDGQNNKRPNIVAEKLQTNACYSLDHKLTPVLLHNVLVKESLLDSGATCSLVKETVAKRANCKISPFVTTVRGLSNSATITVGSTTTTIQTEGLTLELDIFVVPDSSIPYDLIVGKNVLNNGDVQMVTDTDGTTRIQRVSCTQGRTKSTEDLACYTLSGLNDESRERLTNLLERYKHMMATGSKVREVSTGEMKIVTQGDSVVSYRPYRLSLIEREKVRAIIAELLDNDIIRESRSPFTSPIILVKKKNGEDRMCVDYRALNRITKKDRFPLPLIDDQLDCLGGAKYFTTLDMASGFYQIPIAECSIEKTAFVTPDGHYEFKRMPFGLSNAPAVFQRSINAALKNLRNKTCLIYVDDILIPSMTIEEGFKRLEGVLIALDEAGFSLNLKKCSFFKTQIEYLGREISSDGIRPGTGKVNALLEAPAPTNVKQVRQIMGLASYFRKFIPEFAVRTACITKLTKNNVPWEWGEEQECARKYILDKLCSKPLLIIFDPNRETELHTDASSLGYGAILFQRLDGDLRVVSYYSRRTTPEESRYHSYELETLAIVNALKHFRVYLLGITFKIVTDCNAIKATSNKKDLIPRIARWWMFLQDYTFELEYRKGKCIEHVDYLSRNPPKDYRVDFICEGSWLEVMQKKDDETKDIIDKINANHTVSTDFEIRQERLTLFGTPRIIVFDRATNFTYKPLQQFIKKHGSMIHFIATGAPRANGQAERYVGTVTNLLTVEIKKGAEWPNKLAKLMLTLNTTVQKSTGFSPCRLLFGLDQGPGIMSRVEEQLPPTNEVIDVVSDRDVAAKRLEENAASQELRFNKTRRNNIVYKEGDTVFTKPADDRRAKLAVKYLGSFTISKVLENDRFEIIGKSGRPQTVPIDRLRLWRGEWDNEFDLSDGDVEDTEEPC
ncbi:uncharacterized protein LOC143181127 [Calliopsis andreniformis]|uniref:uncharacterized protein LOC143181127 n=1 Tax=Calliopsis andreniformis TaxID=337506 RepID=UPI003FCD765A